MTQLFVNNLVVKLASGIDNISNTIAVENTTSFPVMVQGDWFYLTLSDKREGGELRWEVVKVTSYSTNTLTVIRAQSDTTAQSWSVGSELSLRVTAADMFELEAFKDSKGQVNGLAPLDSSSQVPVLNIPNLDAGKLTSGIIDPARYVAADLLTKIKTVDGASSGLDADLLDGQQGSYFQKNLDNVQYVELGNSLTGDRDTTLEFHSSNGVDYSAKIVRTSGVDGWIDIIQSGNGGINVRNGSSFLRDGHTIWHDGLGAKSFSASGYQKLPSGLIIQWGRVSHVVGTNNGDIASTVFTFPIAFPNGVLNVTVANSGGGDEFLENISASTDTSNTSTNIFSRRVYGGNSDVPVSVSILAIGY